MPHVNTKPPARWKFGSNKKLNLERTFNGLGKPLKDPIQIIEKNSKHQSEIAAFEKNHLLES